MSVDAHRDITLSKHTLVVIVQKGFSGTVENGEVGKNDSLTGDGSVSKGALKTGCLSVDLGGNGETGDFSVVQADDGGVIVVVSEAELPPITLGDRDRGNGFSNDGPRFLADTVNKLNSVGCFGMLGSDVEQKGILYSVSLTVNTETLVNDVSVDVDRVVRD